MKNSPSGVVEQFIDFFLLFINPKFSSDAEKNIGLIILTEFAKECSLTIEEMKQAIKMAARGELTSSLGGKEVQIRLFREIDRLKLEEIAASYTEYRNGNLQHEKGLKMLSKILEPLPKEPSEEEKNELNARAFEYFVRRYNTENRLHQIPSWVYDYLVKQGIMLPFLSNLSPEQKRQMRKEVAQTLSRELATTNKERYEAYKQALFDFKAHKNENQPLIASVKKTIAIKWYLCHGHSSKAGASA